MVTTIGNSAKNVRADAMSAYRETIASPNRTATLDSVAAKADVLHKFIYEYTYISDTPLDTDDEIINWTFIDVIDDLSNAIWNGASGFYKAGASSLRNAYELSMVSLAFNIENNVNPSGLCYDTKFGAWGRGEIDTPNWGYVIPKLNSLQTIREFNRLNCFDFVKEAHEFYHTLCAYTHSRTFDKNTKEPTNSMWLGVGTPQFDDECFDRFIALVEQTMSWIASVWAVSYPAMLVNHGGRYTTLFGTGRGSNALNFSDKWALAHIP